MVDLSQVITIVTLNIRDLRTGVKRQRLLHLIEKQDPTMYCLQEINFKYRNRAT